MSVEPRSTIIATIDEIEPDSEGELIATLVTDAGQILTIPRVLLPEPVKVSDVIQVSFEHDDIETAMRRERLADLQHRLFGNW